MKKSLFNKIKKIVTSAFAFLGVGLLGYITVAMYYKEPVKVAADSAPILGDTYFTGDYYGANIFTENGLFNFNASPYLFSNVSGTPSFGFSTSLGTSFHINATCDNGTQKTYYGLKIQEKTANSAALPESGYYILSGLPHYVNSSSNNNFAAGSYFGAFVMKGSDFTLDLSAPYYLANIYQRNLSSEYYGVGGYYSTINFIFNAADIKNAFDSPDNNNDSFNLVFVYNPPDNTTYTAGKNVGLKNLSMVYVETQGEADTGYLNGFAAGYESGYADGLAEQNYRGPFASATVRAGIISSLYYQDYHLNTEDIVLDNPAPFVITAAASTNNLMELLADDYQENAPSSAPLLREVFGYEFTFAPGVWSTSAFGSIGFGLEFGNSVYIDISDASGNLITTYEGNSADDYYQLNYVNLSQYKDAFVTRILYTAARSDLIYNFRVDFSSSYSTGYNAGYSDGYNAGSSQYSVGYDAGYNDGYARGAESGSYTLLGPIAAIAGIPATVLTSLFNFNVLGVNILGLVTGFITIAVIAWVIKKFI